MLEYLTFLVTIRFPDSESFYVHETRKFAISLKPLNMEHWQAILDAFESYKGDLEGQSTLRGIIDQTDAIGDLDSYSVQETEQIYGSTSLSVSPPAAKEKSKSTISQIKDWIAMEKNYFSKNEGLRCPSPPCASADIGEDEKTNNYVCNDCGCGWSRK